MSKNERILKCDSLMIRKSILSKELLGLVGEKENIKRFRKWCEEDEIVSIIKTSETLGKELQIVISKGDESAIFVMDVNGFNEYFVGYGLIPTGCANHVIDFINGYKYLKYDGVSPHTEIKYDIMELAYDLNHIEEPTNDQYIMSGGRFINRLINIGCVENTPYANLIDQGVSVPQVKPLTDEDYITIAQTVRKITKDGNIHFSQK